MTPVWEQSDSETGRSTTSAARWATGTPALLRWSPAAALVLYAVCALFWWAEEGWRPEWDSALYLLTARALADGEGYRYLGEPFFLRPPGLSWMLSHLVRDGGFDFAALNQLFMLWAATAVATIHLALRREHGRGLAIAAALLTGLSPLFVDRFNAIESDLPFVALLFASLALLDRGARGGPTALAAALVGTVSLAGAIYLRSAGLVALPGVALVYSQQQRGWRRLVALLPVAGVAGLVAPWLAYARAAAAAATRPSEQLLLFDYTTALLRTDPGDPASPLLSFSDWTERIANNAGAMAHDLAKSVLGVGDPWAIALLLVLVGLGFAGAMRRGASSLDWFALAYAALLLVYFTSEARLLVSLLPMVYAYVLSALVMLLRGTTRRLRSSWSIPLTRCGVAIALLGLAAVEFSAFPRHLDLRQRRVATFRQGAVWDDLAAAGDWLRANTPTDAAVLTGPAPMLALLSERTVYSYRFARVPDLLRGRGIDFAVLFPWTPAAIRRQIEAHAAQHWKLPSATARAWIRIVEIPDDGRSDDP